MSNTSIVIDPKQFKSAARSLRQSMRSMEDAPSHSQSLEMLSHALFGKPYSEALHTILLKQSGGQGGEPEPGDTVSADDPHEDSGVRMTVEVYDIDYDLSGVSDDDLDLNDPLPATIRMELDPGELKAQSGELCDDRLRERISHAITERTGIGHSGFAHRVVRMDHPPGATAQVHILFWENCPIVTLNGEYMTGWAGRESYTPTLEEARVAAVRIAQTDRALGGPGTVREVGLPPVIAEPFLKEDVIDLASSLGVFDNAEQVYGDYLNVFADLESRLKELCSLQIPLRVDLRYLPISFAKEAVRQWVMERTDCPEYIAEGRIELHVRFENGQEAPDYFTSASRHSYVLDQIVDVQPDYLEILTSSPT